MRPAGPADREGVLALAAASLGWGSDERHERFFSWKHDENPFGASPMWVAEAGGRIVGFRTFLSWEFEGDGRAWRAGRAVDTATHPDFQGRGIFTKLTLAGLDALAAAGRDFVFNTPNDQSRPGYLKMGWHVVGRVPIGARPLRPSALPRLARARTAAGKWSVVPPGGEHPREGLADEASLGALLASSPTPTGLRTRRSVTYLRWRYGFEPLHYRVVRAAGGLAVFRVRPRGPAREAALCELLVPPGEAGAARALVRAVGRASGADYVVRAGTGGGGPRHRGFVPLPRQGPILTWRHTSDRAVPPPARWDLTLGDVELF